VILNIHVVVPGDNPWALARRYSVSESSISQINGLATQKHLVVGQALLIPTPDNINYGVIESNGFIQPSNIAKETEVLQESVEYLTYLTAFSHHVTADGSLEPLRDETINNIGRNNNAAIMLSVTNLNGSNFDTDLISRILNSEALRQKLIGEITTKLRTGNYYGVIIDFERIPPADRNAYNNFLRALTQQVHNEKKIIATALAPKTYDIQTGSWHGAHDYRAHGQIVDFVIIMTYEWGWSGGPPMAVAPLNEVRKVISYAVSVIPNKKIMMGIPLYGYDWTLPYVPKGDFAESIGCLEAVDRAARVNASIKYDLKAQSPYYNYYGIDKAEHEVWFEDARSIMAKFKLVNEFALRGVSYWSLGKPFPQNWYMLDNLFKITKVVK
jgi:spore germination protein